MELSIHEETSVNYCKALVRKFFLDKHSIRILFFFFSLYPIFIITITTNFASFSFLYRWFSAIIWGLELFCFSSFGYCFSVP